MRSLILLTIVSTVVLCDSACEYPWIQIGPNSKCYLVSHDASTYFGAQQVFLFSMMFK